MAKTDYQSVAQYLAAQPGPARAILERVRAALMRALPGATEGISYQIPVFKRNGVMVLYFAGFERHYSIYPATTRVVSALKKELAKHLHSKATLRFSYADPVPTRLIARIAKLRAAEAAELARARAARKVEKSKPAPRRKPTNRR